MVLGKSGRFHRFHLKKKKSNQKWPKLKKKKQKKWDEGVVVQKQSGLKKKRLNMERLIMTKQKNQTEDEAKSG